MSSRLCVLGSVYMDLVMRTERFPHPGETLRGGDFRTYAGGKGADQAVAAARLGADIDLIGCIGDDAWGAEIRANLVAEGVGVDALQTLAEVPTGVGVIAVVPEGQNAIVLAPGANDCVEREHVERAREAIVGAQLFLAHPGVPDEALVCGLEIARAAGIPTVFNAAPIRPLPDGLFELVQVLVVNERQGRELARCDEQVSPAGLARRLGALGPERVVVTLGKRGAVLFDGINLYEQESFEVQSVDATASGDAFVGALAVALAEERRVEDCLRFACAAGSLSAASAGAMSSLPGRAAVDELVGKTAPTGS